MLQHALDNWNSIKSLCAGRRVALFLDYDGTLTPIVPHPQQALLPDRVRELMQSLAALWPVAIVSGRDRADVKQLVGLDELVYAGSHGFDISGPAGLRYEPDGAAGLLERLDAAEATLRALLRLVDGAAVERKRFSVAVHFRHVAENDLPAVNHTAQRIVADFNDLRCRRGSKKTFEIQPDVDWHKGRAVTWLIEQLPKQDQAVLPIYVGDDRTDEDAFQAVRAVGVGIRVGQPPEATAAAWWLNDCSEVEQFLRGLLHGASDPSDVRH